MRACRRRDDDEMRHMAKCGVRFMNAFARRDYRVQRDARLCCAQRYEMTTERAAIERDGCLLPLMLPRCHVI